MRMGEPKGLLALPSGETLLEWQLERYAAAGGKQAVVVFGFHSERYLARAWKFSGYLTAVVNPEPELGPFRSLQAGLAAFAALDGGCFVLPVDAPAPSPAVWSELLRCSADADTRLAVVPAHAGRGRHPVWLHGDFAARLLALDPHLETSRLDVQLRSIPAERYHRCDFASWPWPANLNCPEDYAAFCAALLDTTKSPPR